MRTYPQKMSEREDLRSGGPPERGVWDLSVQLPQSLTKKLQESVLVSVRACPPGGRASEWKPFLDFSKLCVVKMCDFSGAGWGRRRRRSDKHKRLYQHFFLFYSPSSSISSLQCSHTSFRGYHSIKPGDSFTLVTKTTVSPPSSRPRSSNQTCNYTVGQHASC